jgi:hypothetical protein
MQPTMQPTTKKVATAYGKLCTELESKLANAGSVMVDISAIVVGTVTPTTLRAILDGQGIVVITNAFTPEAYAAARVALTEAYRVDVVHQLDADKRPAANLDVLEVAKNKDYWKSGIIGNKSFGFLYAQPEAKAEAPKVTFTGGLQVAVAPCSAYKANLVLLDHPSSQVALATLLTVTGNKNGMVSQDSVKMHREDLTKPHVDIYGTNESRISRVQAMAIGPGEGDVRLCFARFSHLEDIQKLVSDAVVNPKFYKRTGFIAIPEKHRETMIQTLIKSGALHVGAPGQLIIWKSGVIHLELKQKEGGLISKKKDTSTTSERYVLGTHQPYNLSRQQLLEIGWVADNGFLFHSYNSLNKGNAAGDNSVHLKTTQYKRNRTRSQDEKDRLALAVQGLPNVAVWEAEHPARKLHSMGITQAPEALFTNEVALRIFNDN